MMKSSWFCLFVCSKVIHTVRLVTMVIIVITERKECCCYVHLKNKPKFKLVLTVSHLKLSLQTFIRLGWGHENNVSQKSVWFISYIRPILARIVCQHVPETGGWGWGLCMQERWRILDYTQKRDGPRVCVPMKSNPLGKHPCCHNNDIKIKWFYQTTSGPWKITKRQTVMSTRDTFFRGM